MLLGGVLVNRRTRNADNLGVKLLCLPDEVLDEIALILG